MPLNDANIFASGLELHLLMKLKDLIEMESLANKMAIVVKDATYELFLFKHAKELNQAIDRVRELLSSKAIAHVNELLSSKLIKGE